MASTLSDRYKGRMAALNATSTTRYKATLHNGASRPTAATTVYAATGLGELATTTNYTTGGAGLTGGIAISATLTGYVLSFADKTITTSAGETIGPFDTINVWDTSDSNGNFFTIDLQQYSISSTTSSGSPTVTGVTGASTQLSVGMPVTGTGIAASTTIAAISGTTVTLSQNATASGTVTLTYGFGAQTASNGGNLIIDFAASTVTASVA